MTQSESNLKHNPDQLTALPSEQDELLEYAHVLVRDLDDHIVRWNKGMEKLYGWTREEALGQITHQLFKTRFPESLEASQAQLRREGHWEGELTHTSKSGRLITVASHQFVHKDPQGRPQLILEVNNDITDLKRIQVELQIERENFIAAFASNPAALVITRLSDGKFIQINAAHSKMFGYTQEELSGRMVSEVNMYASPDARQELVGRLQADGRLHNQELMLRTRTGELRTMLISMEIIQFNDEPCILSTLLDVSERRRAEQDLVANRRLLQDIIDNTSSLVYALDTEGRFILINHKIERIFNRPRHEILGHPREDLMPIDFARIHRANDLEIQTSGQERTIEEENLESDGRHVYLTTKFPMRDASGAIFAVCGISTDMTALKQMEEELRRSNAELEQFAYVASHDLQEPLRSVAGMMQLLQQRYQGKLDGQADEYIYHAVEAAARMQALINDLLAFSRVDRQGKAFAPVSAESCLRVALRNLEAATAESQAQITWEALPVVSADGLQLTQVFQNLVGNSLKFRSQHPPQVRIEVHQDLQAWVFSVQDNGIGIEAQYFERIFQVFQRLHTRRIYSGTGIGLALCKKIIERHGGRIWVESEPGTGATFFFTLPIRDEQT